jgi:hypothetical protein
MKNKIYIFSKLSKFDSCGIRLGGPGLGNILFPWARSVVFANQHQLSRINTTWTSFKIGPILRREKDTRFYADLFNDTRNIGGIQKFCLLNCSKEISENDAEAYVKENNAHFPAIVCFKGMEGLFRPIINNSAIVKKELYLITAQIHKEKIAKHDRKAIGVHIRMGDFAEPPSEDFLREGHWNYRLPLKWYVAMVEKIRNTLGYDLKVNVFSDGKDEELKEVLDLPNVTRCDYGSSIADMLALSENEILIASASTFSKWASYLGRMPTIWYPGTHRHVLFPSESIFEGEVDYEDVLTEELFANIEYEIHGK